MNKAKKNVVIVGFLDEVERKFVSIPYIENGMVHYVDSLSDATKYQGYYIIIDNSDDLSVIEIDKKYRRTLNRFEIIYIYNEKYKDKYYKYSRIQTINRDIFRNLGYQLSCDWDAYKKRVENATENIKYNKDKEEKLNILYNFIKDKKEITTKEIKNNLNLSERSIQRYMKDINDIYKSVGYDYSNNKWYFIW